MLCPPITESSWEPMAVEEDQEQEERKEGEEDKMKALSCMDRVRGLNFLPFFTFHLLLLWNIFVGSCVLRNL